MPASISTQCGAGGMPPGLEGGQLSQLQTLFKLNMAELSLSIAKVENKLVNNVASVADNLNSVSDNMNEKFRDSKIDLRDNSIKLDGFQNMVVTLNGRVTGLGEEVFKHKANIVENKDKISQIEIKVQENTEKMDTDYVKKQDLKQIDQDQGTSVASHGITDMNSASGQGLSLKKILTGAFQMASRPARIFHGEIEHYIKFVTMF